MMEAPLIPPEIVAATGASRNTVKATLTRLVNAGLLVRQGSGRSVHYTKR